MKGSLPWLQGPKERVAQSMQADRVPHAWMIYGAKGLGKLEFAKYLARQLLCINQPLDGPCGSCAACSLSQANNHPDFISVTPADGKTSISVDQVRSLAQSLTLKSHQGVRKVALLCPADVMTVNAANSLLKTLEEPAGDSVILLVCDNPGGLPRTIMSRCQRLPVSTPGRLEALSWLETQDPTTEWAMPLAIARGSPPLAKDWYDEGKLETGRVLINDLIKLCRRDCSPGGVVARWEKEGKWALLWLQAWSQDLIKAKLGVCDDALVLRDFTQDLHDVSKNIKLRDIFNYLDELRVATAGFDGPANKQLMLESLLIPWQNGLTKPVG